MADSFVGTRASSLRQTSPGGRDADPAAAFGFRLHRRFLFASPSEAAGCWAGRG
jgi:hypothetical protein